MVSLTIIVFAMIPIFNVYKSNYEHEKILQQKSTATTLTMKHLDNEKKRFLEYSRGVWSGSENFISADKWTDNSPAGISELISRTGCAGTHKDTPIIEASADRTIKIYNPAIEYSTTLIYSKNIVPGFDATSDYQLKDGIPVNEAQGGKLLSINQNLLLKLTACTTWQDQNGKNQKVEVDTYVTNR